MGQHLIFHHDKGNDVTTFQGHRNWNHWNVALWINNDQGLYTYTRELKRELGTESAARQVVEVRYVSWHQFCGQRVESIDSQVTVGRGMLRLRDVAHIGGVA